MVTRREVTHDWCNIDGRHTLVFTLLNFRDPLDSSVGIRPANGPQLPIASTVASIHRIVFIGPSISILVLTFPLISTAHSATMLFQGLFPIRHH